MEGSAAERTITVNGKPRTFPGDLSVAGLLEALGMRPEVVHVQVNGHTVARQQFHQVQLEEGDEVDIVMSMGGGCRPMCP